MISRSLSSTNKRLAESSLWYLTLVSVAAIGFLNGGFAESHWLVFSALFYGLSAVVLAFLLLGARVNHSALVSARPVIMLLMLSLLWLWSQRWLSVPQSLYDLFDSQTLAQSKTPNWFTPELRWSVTPERGRWLLLSELHLFNVFLIVLLLLDSRRRLKQLLFVLIAVGVVHALTGLAAKFAGVLFVDPKEVDGHFTAARGLFVNRNHFGGFLVLCSVGALAYQIRNLMAADSMREHLRQYLYLSNVFVSIALLVLLSACLASESRGALLAMLVALIAGFSMLGIQRFVHARWLLLAVIVIILVAGVYFGQGLLARFLTDTLSFGERPLQWSITFNAISQNPWFGYGGGSYGTVFQIFRETVDLRQVFFAQSHNHYLHLWLERGLIGLSFWLAIWAYVVWFLRRKLCEQRSRLVLATLCAISVGLIAALVQSFVDFNLQILNIRAYFMVLLAMAFAVPHIKHR